MNQQINEQIRLLEAENTAIQLKIYALGLAGGVAGAYYANKQNKSFWGKIGFFLLGDMAARVPAILFYSSKLSENKAKIDNLKSQLIDVVIPFDQAAWYKSKL